jgi:predicted alpha/beta superfamily hydrolase
MKKNRNWKSGIILVALSLILNMVQAQKKEPIVLGEKMVVSSQVLNEEREAWIWLPSDYAHAKKEYPALYLLDGVWHYQHVTGLIHFLSWKKVAKIPEMIVVAVINTARSRDFSPAPWPGYDHYTGGGDRFIDFLYQDLIPAVEREYRVSSQKILAGHSLAGTFTLYTFLSEPELFDAYLALSPCLFWHERFMLKKSQALLDKKPKLEKTLYIAHEYARGEPASTMDEFVTLFEQKAPRALHWKCVFMEGEDHFSYILRAFWEGVEFVFANEERK